MLLYLHHSSPRSLLSLPSWLLEEAVLNDSMPSTAIASGMHLQLPHYDTLCTVSRSPCYFSPPWRRTTAEMEKRSWLLEMTKKNVWESSSISSRTKLTRGFVSTWSSGDLIGQKYSRYVVASQGMGPKISDHLFRGQFVSGSGGLGERDYRANAPDHLGLKAFGPLQMAAGSGLDD